MKKITSFVLVAALFLAAACGGGNGNNGNQEGDSEQLAENQETETEAVVEKKEKKADPKKWYEKDFVLTETMYVGPASITRSYARKGNIVIGTTPGSSSTTLFVCTDSTRTEYLVGNEKKQYGKVREKSGFSSVDDAIYQYLKGQMSETVFGKNVRKGDEGTTCKDTTIFGRPAYVITKETLQKTSVVEVWGKSVTHIDKENGLPYYKWAVIKTNGKVTTEGKVFEVNYFSDKPTYDGLIVSLEGLTQIQ
ncbi:MAG: hypothetical protein IK031_02875 [Bacteroidales bacterium]|nr:hypothetical protein [Bacteroidales bacterium]